MAAWFRKNRQEARSASDPSEEDEMTGPIPMSEIAALVEEIDGASGGTDTEVAASNTAVEPVTAAAPHAAQEPTETATGTAAEQDNAPAERRALVELCLYALDRARSSGVAERIEQGLAEVGVCALRPDGERFDPSRHEAGGAAATDDHSLEGTVAETEIVGFRDRGELLRVPVVTVYTRGGEGAAG